MINMNIIYMADKYQLDAYINNKTESSTKYYNLTSILLLSNGDV